MNCPECGSSMLLKKTLRYTYADGSPRKFYGCSRFPLCKGTHGAHPDGSPLGIPATQDTKRLRMHLHALCERIWGPDPHARSAGNASSNSKRENRANKTAMYSWMRENAPKAHIAEMNSSELLTTERLLKDKLHAERDKL